MKKDKNKTKEELLIELENLRIKSKVHEEKLKTTNQQLIAMDQQLRAANQQLLADNQQLQATEQQLKASYQQLEANNQQLIAAEQALSYNEEKFRLAFKNSPDSINITRLSDGKIVDISDNFERITGYKLKESLGKKTTDLELWANPEDRDLMKEKLASDGNIENFEFIRKMKNGRKAFSVMSAAIITINKEPHLLSVIRDINDLKKTEMNLRESETKLRSIFNNSVDAVGVANKGRHVMANPAYVKMFGYKSEEEIKGKLILDLISPESKKQVAKNIRLRDQDKAPESYETKGLRKDGSVFDLSAHVSSYLLNQKKYTLVVLRDITERLSAEQAGKQAEVALKEQLYRNKQILQSTMDGFILADKDGNLLDVNLAYCNMVGYSNEELLRMNIQQLEVQLSPEEINKRIKLMISKGGAHFETKHKRKDGRTIDIEVTITIMEQNHESMVAAFVRDITERKEFVEKLFNSEQQLRAANQQLEANNQQLIASENQLRLANRKYIENESRLKEAELIAKMGNFIWEIETGKVTWSDGLHALLGYDKKERIDYNKVNAEIHHPDDLERITNWLNECISSGKSNFPPNEYRLLSNDGNVIHVQTSIKILYKDNIPFKMIGTIQDITERKQAEVALREQEHFISAIINTSPALIYVYDMEKQTNVFSNTGLERILGYSQQEIETMGADIVENLIHPDDLASISTFQQQIAAASDENVLGIEYRVRHADGSWRFLRSFERPFLRNDDGSLKQKVGVALDVTELKQAEEAYKEAKSNLQAILDNRKDSIWSLDRNYNYLVFNKPYADVIFSEMGIRIEKGMNALEIHPKEVNDFWKPKFDTVFRGELVTFEFSHVLEGKEHYFEVSLNPIVTDSEITGLSALSMDITERKKAEEELEKYKQHLEELVEERTAELESANKDLESFSYSVSHDLKTPLRAIDGFSKFLIDDYSDKMDSEGLRFLNVIRDNTKKMDTLIKDLLELSHLGRSEIRRSNIDMNSLVNSIIYEITNEESRKRIKFEIGKLFELQGDNAMIKQVWINLLSNAIKYSSKKEKSLISVTCKKGKEECVYCIKDNGVGFNNKYKDKLFGVFQRLHKDEEFEGTGVGLAIVKRIISRHGGKVWAESELGNGAAFYFSLPFSK